MNRFNTDVLEIKSPVPVVCQTASSFPEGILASHQTLHAKVEKKTGRRYFGLSKPINNRIQYKAAAEILDVDPSFPKELETYTIPSGKYLFIELKDYLNHTESIGEAFSQLTADKRLDPDTWCIEWYTDNGNMRCMVRILE